MMNDPLLSVCTEKLYYHPSNGGGREGGTVNRREHLEEAGGKGYLAADGSACRGSAPATLLEEYRVHGTEAPKSECPYISQLYPDYQSPLDAPIWTQDHPLYTAVSLGGRQ